MWWPPIRTNWKVASRPGTPICAPRRFITTRCSRPQCWAANCISPPGSWPPTNVRPPRCGKTSTAISGAWSRASTPIVIIRICIPLTVGIDERKEATVEALFSPKLWTENGLLTRSGDKTFWDRSTLYALRGVYASGETEKATGYLSYYSGVRLLGDHVPYAIEAWPEGSQRHLSAESGLYCRILTEGVFGIRPTGFRSFTLTPRLPAAWDRMNLRNVRAFGSAFDIEVRRAAKGMEVAVTQDGREVVRKRLRAGQSLGVTLE